MWLIDLFLAYVGVVDAVISTAHVWGPLMLGAGSLGWDVRRTPRRRRHRRTRRPDTSGHDPDTPPDMTASAPSSQP